MHKILIITIYIIGLFRKASTDELSYVIVEESTDIEQWEEKYEFFGHMLAKAILDEIPLNLCLNRLIFKIFVVPDYNVTLEDLKLFDQQTYNSLKYIMESKIDEDDYLELTFTHQYKEDQYDLKENGSEISVTDENKEEYINLKVNFMVKHFTTNQLNYIRDGFEELIPLKYLRTLKYREFEYLCNGEPSINIQDWKNNTMYSGGYDINHKVIKWFWNYIDQIEQES